MTDLVEFLRAALDEDERVARVAIAYEEEVDDAPQYRHVVDYLGSILAAHIARHDPARMLAEVAAKRAIVEKAFEYAAIIDGEWGCGHNSDQIERGECPLKMPDKLMLLRLLAQPYAGRPGWREEWAT
jgi:hypothetical protein